MPLPVAFRSLPRPSSPADAKASVVCPYTLALRLTLGIRCNLIPKLSKLSKIILRLAAQKSLQASPRPAHPMVGVPGIEPGTSSLSGTRSNQLSYTPVAWWRRPGSNRRHPACKAGALPTELRPRMGHTPHVASAPECSNIPNKSLFGPKGMRPRNTSTVNGRSGFHRSPRVTAWAAP